MISLAVMKFVAGLVLGSGFMWGVLTMAHGALYDDESKFTTGTVISVCCAALFGVAIFASQ